MKERKKVKKSLNKLNFNKNETRKGIANWNTIAQL